MTLSILIAGEERSKDLEWDSLKIDQVLAYQVDTCTLNIKGDQPVEGEEVIIEWDGIRVFAGVITNVELSRTLTDKSIVVWKVDCDDYTTYMDRKLVVETYENMAADDIIKDIAAKYCPGFTVNGVIPGAPVIEWIRFDYNLPSECMKEICEYVGWHWYVDYYKDIKFFSPANYVEPAPMQLTPGGLFHGLKHKVDIQGLRNRVYVLGGKFLSDPQTFEWVADGKERIWVLPFEPHSPKISINESPPVTPGLEYVDDEANYDYMYNQRDKYIRCSNQTPTPVAGATISLTCRVPMDVITMVEDIPSQQALAAVQGGDGIYEYKIYDEKLITIEAAEAAGMAELKDHANPKIRGSFNSEVPGWKTGQILTINLPDRGIVGEYLIQRVNMQWDSTAKRFRYKIEYGGKLLGIADFLQSLVSSQQRGKIIDVQYQTKYVSGDIPVNILIEFVVTPRIDPWYCGDADAICGEIVCLGLGDQPVFLSPWQTI
ncbi:hypothetical protein [Desulforamulus hydrothermalis]|uniref:Uncharacterized protein n=1 Tax=Desulforamulus hydrothermalis Lam5 = DSM 18033 TaxID=1121428 RepID=K8DZ62_9FIRM|nr:hypothetical protein [Desulforamulus hydrothermalis]CCO08279.1 conserved hypothetical protein [Desulforamulus hydrothermalis Lam5 = DSM 18033]SHH37543.1 hypothetical protein SAMN02745177_02344 [Desulforamulus hydrothermalis Lam5 = DSM 18033]